MTKMRHWDALKTPPKDALKTIGFGPLKGKSDINPQWRYRAMTEHFGPCGAGWGWDVTDRWTDQGPDGTVACFVMVKVWYLEDGERSAGIPGVGGEILVVKDKNGLHINDEAYKMATTDALGCALKMVGVAADVYLGNMDGSKYAPRQTPPPPQPAPEPQNEEAWDLFDSMKDALTDEQRQWCLNELAANHHSQVINQLKKLKG